MSSTYAPSGQSVDIGQILDDGPWTTMQKLVVILAALSIVADGFDGQLIGFAIPLITKEWGVTRGDFAPVVASGLIGMGIGSACAGCSPTGLGGGWLSSAASWSSAWRPALSASPKIFG